jgi:FtsZ-binding cell division protein ZapB
MLIVAATCGVITGFAVCGFDFPTAVAIQTDRFFKTIKDRCYKGTEVEKVVNERNIRQAESELTCSIVELQALLRNVKAEVEAVEQLQNEIDELKSKFAILETTLQTKADDALLFGDQTYSRDDIIAESLVVEHAIDLKKQSLAARKKTVTTHEKLIEKMKTSIESAIIELNTIKKVQQEWNSLSKEAPDQPYPIKVAPTLTKLRLVQDEALNRLQDEEVARSMLDSTDKLSTPLADAIADAIKNKKPTKHRRYR